MTATAGERHGWRADDSEFGARLALIRQRMGWGNVKEAATECGLPVESWRNWERDGRLPRNYVSVCGRISERTGCDLFWLIGARAGDDVNIRCSSSVDADGDESDTFRESGQSWPIGTYGLSFAHAV